MFRYSCSGDTHAPGIWMDIYYVAASVYPLVMVVVNKHRPTAFTCHPDSGGAGTTHA